MSVLTLLYSQMKCEELVAEDEADECISSVKDTKSKDRKCEPCTLTERTDVPVTVSCVDVFPSKEKPDTSTEAEEERAVEDFAAKSKLFFGVAFLCIYR